MATNQRPREQPACEQDASTGSCTDLYESDILNSLGCAVLVVTQDGEVRYRNAAAKALVEDGRIDDALRRIRPFGSFTDWNAELRRMLAAEEPVMLAALRQGSQGEVTTIVTIYGQAIHGRCLQGSRGVVIRIERSSVRELGEDQLLVPHRLATLGTLATRIAHELNNPLDGILRYTTLALRLVEDSREPKLKSYLTQSRTGLVRMVQVIGELLEMARATKGEFDEVAVDEIVQQALDASEDRIAQAGIVVAVDFQNRNMPPIRGTRLYLICCNLIRNAIDAMSDGGRLSITTGQVGDNLIIRVCDTGTGFSVEPGKLFEPFFTTKSPGKGTGIGLAICKEFVEEMSGSITAELGSDGGAVFTVAIPISSNRLGRTLEESPSQERDASARSASTHKG